MPDGRTGWEEVDVVARAVVKHPLPIPPCREWFALFGLCQLRRARGQMMSHAVRSFSPFQTSLFSRSGHSDLSTNSDMGMPG